VTQTYTTLIRNKHSALLIQTAMLNNLLYLLFVLNVELLHIFMNTKLEHNAHTDINKHIQNCLELTFDHTRATDQKI